MARESEPKKKARRGNFPQKGKNRAQKKKEKQSQSKKDRNKSNRKNKQEISRKQSPQSRMQRGKDLKRERERASSPTVISPVQEHTGARNVEKDGAKSPPNPKNAGEKKKRSSLRGGKLIIISRKRRMGREEIRNYQRAENSGKRKLKRRRTQRGCVTKEKQTSKHIAMLGKTRACIRGRERKGS